MCLFMFPKCVHIVFDAPNKMFLFSYQANYFSQFSGSFASLNISGGGGVI